jgi:hypothetical protein
MSRGSVSARQGKRRHAIVTATHTYALAALRADMDGMSANDPEFSNLLDSAQARTFDIATSARLMDKDGLSRSAVCERLAMVATQNTIHNA